MALEDISNLFQSRAVGVSTSDVAYGVERFLQSLLKSSNIQCRNDLSGTTLTIRVGTPALAQAAVIAEHDIRTFLQNELGLTIQTICVLL